METSLVLVVLGLFIGIYSASPPPGTGPSASIAGFEPVAHDGQYPYHVAIVKKETKRVLCDGVIISNKWVMTMKECLKLALLKKDHKYVDSDEINEIHVS